MNIIKGKSLTGKSKIDLNILKFILESSPRRLQEADWHCPERNSGISGIRIEETQRIRSSQVTNSARTRRSPQVSIHLTCNSGAWELREVSSHLSELQGWAGENP